ncbi:Beta-galactosidase [Cellulomonas sp. T2.31MG-18]
MGRGGGVALNDPAASRLGEVLTGAVLDLGGPGWWLREALGETWRWYVDAPLGPVRNSVPDPAAGVSVGPGAAPGWWPATVPGTVVTDLWRCGELSDPYRARQSRDCEWTGTRSWVLRRQVDLADLPSGCTRVLEVDGVDPQAEVLWDGEVLGRTQTLYRQARFALTGAAAGAGPHRLALVIAPVPPGQPQVGRTELVGRHAPRLNEGWDFSPRFPHQGAWKSVRVVTARTHLAQVQVQARLAPDGPDGLVTAVLRLDPGHRGTRVGLEVVATDGGVVASAAADVGDGDDTATVAVTVPQPRHWLPQRLGTPTTYRVRLRVDDDVEPRWEGLTGFRDARLVQAPGAPAGSLPYRLEVDGRPVPGVGWNWAPVDAQHGAVPPARVRHLVDLAARSGAAVLRVWGGGLVETEAFYEACDEAGLLVWQEFSLSSSGLQSAPSTDAEYLELLRRDAEELVPRRTHHPSLLVWAGGNELDDDGGPLTDDRSPALATLHEVVARLDPGRSWLPTSPSGPVFHYRPGQGGARPEDHHDVHGPWEHQGLREQHRLYDSATALAHTEFGVEGMANRRLLEHLVPPSDRWPADRSNPVYRHLGDWWDNAPLVARSFGDRLTDLDQLRRASQLLQATGLAYAVEADRRRWPRCSLVLPWQLAESYPNAWCTSSVDHRGDPKPAFHAVTRAFAAERVTVQAPTSVLGGDPALDAELWLWSGVGRPAGSVVTARLRTLAGDVLGERRWTVGHAVGDPVPVGALQVPADGLPPDAMLLWEALWEGPDGDLVDHELVLTSTASTWAPLLDLAPSAVEVTAVPHDDQVLVHVVHRSGPAVVGLTLADDRPFEAPGWAVPSGDPRPLLPGTARTYRVDWVDAPPEGRALRLESWNAPPVRIDLERTPRT